MKQPYQNLFGLHTYCIGPFAEPVCDEKFLGEVKMSTTEYLDVFEERRQALTTKLPSEVGYARDLLSRLP